MALNIQNEWSKIKNKKSNEWSKIMLVLSKGCKDARYDKCQPISTIIWTLIKKNCGRLPDIPSWSRTFHVGSVPIVSKSIASSNSPKSSFPLTIVNTEFPYVVKTKTSPLPSKAQKKLPVVSSCVSCRGPAYVSVKLLQKKQSSLFLIESHFSCSSTVEPDGLFDPFCPCDLSHRLAWETVLYIVIICNFNVEKITM